MIVSHGNSLRALIRGRGMAGMTPPVPPATCAARHAAKPA